MNLFVNISMCTSCGRSKLTPKVPIWMAEIMFFLIVGSVKVTLWVSVPSTLGFCVFPNSSAIYVYKLT